MEFEVGDEVAVDSSWKVRTSLASQTMRVGTILEVIGEGSRTRYRIRWRSGRESIYRPVAGAIRLASDRANPGFATW